MAMIFITALRELPQGQLLAESNGLEMAVYLEMLDGEPFTRLDIMGDKIFSCRPHRIADVIKLLQEAQQKLGLS